MTAQYLVTVAWRNQQKKNHLQEVVKELEIIGFISGIHKNTKSM